MHLAASPIHEPQESPFDCSLAVQPSCHLQTTNGKFSSDSAILVFPTAHTGDYIVFKSRFWQCHSLDGIGENVMIKRRKR